MFGRKKLLARIEALEAQVRRLENMHATVTERNNWELPTFVHFGYNWEDKHRRIGYYNGRQLTRAEIELQPIHPQPKQVDYQRITKTLSDGFDVVYDATNLSCKRRMNFLKSIAHIECRKECVVVVATPEDIEERMKSRDRKVPMEVVHKQLCQFQCPNYYEGWDSIWIEYNSKPEDCHASYKKLWAECDIPHDNPHHSLSVMEHMNQAADIAEDLAWKDDDLSLVNERWVARIHDIGKARTKSFIDRNGNPSEVAHYIGHQNYGAYYSLIFDNSDFDISLKDSLDNACLIQWHMEHYLRKGEALLKFYAMFPPKFRKRLKVLEKADMTAH